jgi:hypothetical protein
MACSGDDLGPTKLTWAALLGRWIEFAKASMALPDDAEGDRWRESVAAVINLQAVTFALADLAPLPPDECALALDKSRIIIDDNVDRLHAIWSAQKLPVSLVELCQDAQLALTTASGVYRGGG